MSANLLRRLLNNNKTLEDYLNRNCSYEGYEFPESFYNSPILNIVQINGIMGRKEQQVLKEHYPGLQEAVLEFLSKKNHGRLMIYEEGEKPTVINFFVYNSAGSNGSQYCYLVSALKSFFALRRNGKIQGTQFVFLNETTNTTITTSIRNRLGWTDELYELGATHVDTLHS